MPEDSHSADTDRTTLSTDALLSTLSQMPRRTVLFHLRQHGAATFDELVDVLAEVGEHGTGEVEPDYVATSLVHVHFPKLEEAGLVTYDSDERVVKSTARLAEIGEWLDLAVRRDIRTAPVRTFENQTAAENRETIRVLLVDDEPGLPETIAGYIERENDDIEVTTRASALDAVAALDEQSFDCIVSDYQMPAISGLDLLKAVREEDPEIPFIVFTAKGSETTASEAIATNVTDYIQKRPDTEQYDELAERIRRAVE
jgi:CheY-like chemotaxis protein